MRELQLDQLRTLVTVVDLGSFDAAAAALHITPSAVSQRIRALEDGAGRILVRRDRPVAPTESGEALLRTARQMLHLEDVARGELATASGSGHGDLVVVPLACNSDSLATWFLDVLAAVPNRDRMLFDVRREDESRSAELLRRGEVMAAVTAESRAVPGCVSRPLGALRYLACASPTFIDHRLAGDPDPAGLGSAPAVDFDHGDGLQERFYREWTGRQLGRARHHIPSTHDHLRAVIAGLGWGLVPEQLAASSLDDGELVDLAPGHTLDVPLYWQHWKVRSPAIDELTEVVHESAARLLHR